MLFFFAVIVLLGFFPKQDKRYWMLGALALVVQALAGILFNASGTLENPSGDGYITGFIRQMTKDGSSVLWVFPFAMLMGWVVPIYIVYKGYKRKIKGEEVISPK
jgi:hypothetical protein